MFLAADIVKMMEHRLAVDYGSLLEIFRLNQKKKGLLADSSTIRTITSHTLLARLSYYWEQQQRGGIGVLASSGLLPLCHHYSTATFVFILFTGVVFCTVE